MLIPVLVLLLLSTLYLENFQLDYCYIDRRNLPNSSTAAALHNAGVCIVLISLILVGLWKDPLVGHNFRVNWNAIFAASACFLCFQPAMVTVLALKDTIKDFLCNAKHTNSVSGHACFYLYFMLCIPYLVVGLKRDPASYSNFVSGALLKKLFSRQLTRRAAVMVFMCVAVYAAALVNLYNTFMGGYHSPRQMVYGGIVGCIFASICIYILPPVSFSANQHASAVFRRQQLVTWIIVGLTIVSFGAGLIINAKRVVKSFHLMHVASIIMAWILLFSHINRMRNTIATKKDSPPVAAVGK